MSAKDDEGSLPLAPVTGSLRPDPADSAQAVSGTKAPESSAAAQMLQELSSVSDEVAVQALQEALRDGRVSVDEAREILVHRTVEQELCGVTDQELISSIQDEIKAYLQDDPTWHQIFAEGGARTPDSSAP